MSGRRGFLTGTVAAMVLPVAALPAPVQPSRVSPELASMFARYQASGRAIEKASAASSECLARIVARHGDILDMKFTNLEQWEMDPERPRLRALNAETDRLCGVETDQLTELMDYPAKSVADIAVKMQAVLAVWRDLLHLKDEGEFHGELALQFFEEAEKVFGIATRRIEA